MPTHPSLVDRSVIVTGGSRGLGREMALALLEAGAKVAVIGTSRSAEMEQTLAAAAALGAADRILPLVADVKSLAECRRAVAATLTAFGGLHVVINNAGLGQQFIADRSGGKMPTRFWEVDPEAWRELVDVNVHGVFNMTVAAMATFLAQDFGRIINLSTNDRTMLRPAGTPYGPSKAFVETATRVWAGDLEGRNITVNVLLPGGPVDTGIRKADWPVGFQWIPIAVMRAPTLWLASDASNGYTAGRYLARLWDETLPLADRIKAARDDGGKLPRIM